MRMNIAEIKVRAEQLLSESIEDTDAIDWVNDCIHEMGEKVWPEKNMSFVAEAGHVYILPNDFVSVIALTKDGRPYRRYIIRNDKLLFPDSGTYDLAYRSYFKRLESVEDEISLSPMYMLPMVKYLMSCQLVQNGEVEMSMKWESEFRQGISDLKSTVEYKNKPFRVKTNF